MFKFKKIALAASIFTATALSLAAFAACGEPVKGDKGDKGDKGETGATGATGAAGQDGKDGVGIEDIKAGEDGKLIITMTNGTKKEVAMPTVDAPVAEEHTLTKDPITIINNAGQAGTLAAGQTGIGLYYCTDCGDVFAKSAHAHNLTAWAKITSDATEMTFERDCLVFKNGSAGDTEKVADEHQTIKMISYSDAVAADGSLKEGWKKDSTAQKPTYKKVAAETNGLWVVIVDAAAECNAEGKAAIKYYTADGPETKDTNNNDAVVYEGVTYKATAITLTESTANTDAEKEAIKVPVTGHFFDITQGKIFFEGQYPTKTVGGETVKLTASEITGQQVEAGVAQGAFTAVAAQGTGNTIASGYNKAAYFVVCENCGTSAAKAVKVYDTTVTTEVTRAANCAETQQTTITATMKIVAGDKTFTKAETVVVNTGAATAPTNVTGHVYNVYKKGEGDVVAYYNNGTYYTAADLKTAYSQSTTDFTIFRKEGDVVAVNCANCSGGRIAYDIPKTVLTEDNDIWSKSQTSGDNVDASESAEGKVTYVHDFATATGVTSGTATIYKAVVTTAKLNHVNKFTLDAATDFAGTEVAPANVANLKVGAAVDVSCKNADDGYGVANRVINNDISGSTKKYNTVEVTAIDKVVTQEQTCTLPEKTTYTVTVTAYTQKLDEADLPVFDGKTGAPVWDTSKTKTYTQTYEVQTNAAAGHATTSGTAYVQTVVAYPTATELGLLEYKCSLCGDVYYYVLPAINSNTNNSRVSIDDTTNPVTCTKDGFTVYSSSYIETDEADITDKDYALVSSTSNEAKVSFKKDGEKALGHKMGAWKSATGTGTNYKWIRYCERVQANGTLDGYFEVSNADSNPDAE